MEIIRKYKKDSKHKYWKITLARFSVWGLETTQELEFEAYGFSSSRDIKSGYVTNNCSYNIEYIGRSRKEVLSKEEEMIRMYFESIKESLKNTEEQIADHQKDKRKMEELMKDSTFVRVFREDKLKRMMNGEYTETSN